MINLKTTILSPKPVARQLKIGQRAEFLGVFLPLPHVFPIAAKPDLHSQVPPVPHISSGGQGVSTVHESPISP